MAGRRLKLQKYELLHVNFLYLGGFRLRVEASDPLGSGADPNVFLFLRDVLNPYDQTIDDLFQGVASVVDMAEYPVGEPNNNTTYPMFRLDFFEIDLRTTELAQKTWLLVQEEVSNLLLILDRMEQLEPTEEVWVGAPEEDEGGSSSSSSVSA